MLGFVEVSEVLSELNGLPSEIVGTVLAYAADASSITDCSLSRMCAEGPIPVTVWVLSNYKIRESVHIMDAISRAVTTGNCEAVKIIVRYLGDETKRLVFGAHHTDYLKRVMKSACEYGYFQTAEWLMGAFSIESDIYRLVTSVRARSDDVGGAENSLKCTALEVFMSVNDFESVKWLEPKMDIYQASYKKESAILRSAIRGRNLEILEWLCQKIHIPDLDRTITVLSYDYNYLQGLQWLSAKNKGVVCWSEGLGSSAVLNGLSPEIVQWIIDTEKFSNKIDYIQFIVSMKIAGKLGSIDLTELLLAKLNTDGARGNSLRTTDSVARGGRYRALQGACNKGNIRYAKWLISHYGAENTVPGSAWSALRETVRHNDHLREARISLAFWLLESFTFDWELAGSDDGRILGYICALESLPLLQWFDSVAHPNLSHWQANDDFALRKVCDMNNVPISQWIISKLAEYDIKHDGAGYLFKIACIAGDWSLIGRYVSAQLAGICAPGSEEQVWDAISLLCGKGELKMAKKLVAYLRTVDLLEEISDRWSVLTLFRRMCGYCFETAMWVAAEFTITASDVRISNALGRAYSGHRDDIFAWLVVVFGLEDYVNKAISYVWERAPIDLFWW